MKFKRRKGAADGELATSPEIDSTEPAEHDDEPAPVVAGASADRAGGPFDVTEVDLDPADQNRVDLGSLVVAGTRDVELRLQVDEASGEVAALLLVAQDGAVEVRAFAAPRHEEIWPEVRESIVAEAERQGGAVDQVTGPWGDELKMLVQGQTEDGQMVTQATRVVGISGPRWLLRATYFGAPAAEDLAEHPVEVALRKIVVRRGKEAMPPGEFLPLVLPAQARRMA